MAKRKDQFSLSMKVGQDRTQVAEAANAKADLVLDIRVDAFANKGDLIRGIDVLRGHADNMDWPPFSDRKSTVEPEPEAIPEMEPPEEPETGECPDCGGTFKITKDGYLYAHKCVAA